MNKTRSTTLGQKCVENPIFYNLKPPGEIHMGLKGLNKNLKKRNDNNNLLINNLGTPGIFFGFSEKFSTTPENSGVLWWVSGSF